MIHAVGASKLAYSPDVMTGQRTNGMNTFADRNPYGKGRVTVRGTALSAVFDLDKHKDFVKKLISLGDNPKLTTTDLAILAIELCYARHALWFLTAAQAVGMSADAAVAPLEQMQMTAQQTQRAAELTWKHTAKVPPATLVNEVQKDMNLLRRVKDLMGLIAREIGKLERACRDDFSMRLSLLNSARALLSETPLLSSYGARLLSEVGTKIENAMNGSLGGTGTTHASDSDDDDDEYARRSLHEADLRFGVGQEGEQPWDDIDEMIPDRRSPTGVNMKLSGEMIDPRKVVSVLGQESAQNGQVLEKQGVQKGQPMSLAERPPFVVNPPERKFVVRMSTAGAGKSPASQMQGQNQAPGLGQNGLQPRVVPAQEVLGQNNRPVSAVMQNRRPLVLGNRGASSPTEEKGFMRPTTASSNQQRFPSPPRDNSPLREASQSKDQVQTRDKSPPRKASPPRSSNPPRYSSPPKVPVPNRPTAEPTGRELPRELPVKSSLVVNPRPSTAGPVRSTSPTGAQNKGGVSPNQGGVSTSQNDVAPVKPIDSSKLRDAGFRPVVSSRPSVSNPQVFPNAAEVKAKIRAPIEVPDEEVRKSSVPASTGGQQRRPSPPRSSSPSGRPTSAPGRLQVERPVSPSSSLDGTIFPHLKPDEAQQSPKEQVSPRGSSPTRTSSPRVVSPKDAIVSPKAIDSPKVAVVSPHASKPPTKEIQQPPSGNSRAEIGSCPKTLSQVVANGDRTVGGSIIAQITKMSKVSAPSRPKTSSGKVQLWDTTDFRFSDVTDGYRRGSLDDFVDHVEYLYKTNPQGMTPYAAAVIRVIVTREILMTIFAGFSEPESESYYSALDQMKRLDAIPHMELAADYPDTETNSNINRAVSFIIEMIECVFTPMKKVGILPGDVDHRMDMYFQMFRFFRYVEKYEKADNGLFGAFLTFAAVVEVDPELKTSGHGLYGYYLGTFAVNVPRFYELDARHLNQAGKVMFAALLMRLGNEKLWELIEDKETSLSEEIADMRKALGTLDIIGYSEEFVKPSLPKLYARACTEVLAGIPGLQYAIETQLSREWEPRKVKAALDESVWVARHLFTLIGPYSHWWRFAAGVSLGVVGHINTVTKDPGYVADIFQGLSRAGFSACSAGLQPSEPIVRVAYVALYIQASLARIITSSSPKLRIFDDMLGQASADIYALVSHGTFSAEDLRGPKAPPNMAYALKVLHSDVVSTLEWMSKNTRKVDKFARQSIYYEAVSLLEDAIDLFGTEDDIMTSVIVLDNTIDKDEDVGVDPGDDIRPPRDQKEYYQTLVAALYRKAGYSDDDIQSIREGIQGMQ